MKYTVQEIHRMRGAVRNLAHLHNSQPSEIGVEAQLVTHMGNETTAEELEAEVRELAALKPFVLVTNIDGTLCAPGTAP